MQYLLSPRVEHISVKDVMTKNVVTANLDASVIEIAELMKRYGIGSVVVIDDKRNPVGIVTERDLVIKVLAEHRSPAETRVREIMSKPIISVSSKTGLLDAARIMARRNIRRLVVIDEGKLVGIVTSKDILKVAPEIIDILMESTRIAEPFESSIAEVEVIAGYCDECGEWSESLREIEGKMICPECRANYQSSEVG